MGAAPVEVGFAEAAELALEAWEAALDAALEAAEEALELHVC